MSDDGSYGEQEGGWVQYAEEYGDDAFRQYFEQQPSEYRQQLLADPEIAEIYRRAGGDPESASMPSTESEGQHYATELDEDDYSTEQEEDEEDSTDGTYGTQEGGWVQYAEEYGDDAFRQYFEQQPSEFRQQLLTDPEIAEIYRRAGGDPDSA